MGGQQFARDAVLLDTRSMNRILHLDGARGIVEAEAGIQWPDLIDGLLTIQHGQAQPWSIIQKQTGADRLTLGGALGANIHGRGLAVPADHRRRRIVHPDGRGGNRAHLQPQRERRAVPPRDRRLWPVRRRHARAPAG